MEEDTPEDTPSKMDSSPPSDLSTQSQDPPSLEGMWEVPYVFCFLKMYSEVLSLENLPFVDVFEQYLVEPKPNSFLINVFVKTVSYLSSSSVSAQNWETMLNRLLKKHALIYWETSPMIDKTFEELSCRCKIRILRCICDWLISDSHVFYGCVDRQYDNWRIFPLGKDQHKDVYWYLDDFRLYKEVVDNETLKTLKRNPNWVENPPKWNIVCRTMLEWEDFCDTLRESKNKDEKALLQELEALLPEIKEEYEEKEREILRQELLNAPPIKRSTRIQAREIQKLEEMKQMSSNEEEPMNEQEKISMDREKRLAARQEKIELMKILEELPSEEEEIEERIQEKREDEDKVIHIKVTKRVLSELRRLNREEERRKYREIYGDESEEEDEMEDDEYEEYDDEEDDDDYYEEGYRKKRKQRKEMDNYWNEENVKKRYQNQKMEREMRQKKRQRNNRGDEDEYDPDYK